MSWVKLDDAFATHPKIVGLSDKAFRAHIAAMCWSAQHGTDGFVPAAMGTKYTPELERAGLWDEGRDGGWMIHDFLAYNLSREQWQELKQKRSKAGSKGAAKRWQQDGKPIAVPDPDPENPDPETTTAPRVDANPNQPTEDQIYLARKLAMAYELKRPLDIPQIVKLNREFGRNTVLEAMRSIGDIPGDIRAASIFPFVRGVCLQKAGVA